MYTQVSNKPDFPSIEEDMLRYWSEHDTFQRSMAQRREGAKAYVFYDGPPFATGLPHYGHLLAGTIKDIVPRYHTMRGHFVERRFGWDCHGLPIEALAQEALGLNGAADIRARGVDVFNEQCRSMVLRYVAEWRDTVSRMGRWVDFDKDYKTMDPEFMETIWWVFKQIWEQGRIYRSYRIMPYSWKLNTPLSNFEAGNNYRDVQDPSITLRVRLKARPKAMPSDGEAWLLLWTTTPWTLPGNLAVCAGPEVEYVAVRDESDGALYVLANARFTEVFPKQDGYSVVARFPGSALEGCRYEPLFPYFSDRSDAFRVLTDPFVSTAEGTGLVHMAPAYGEDDFRVCSAEGIALVDCLDENAAFTDAVPEHAGVFCKDADKAIIRRLKENGRLVHQSTLVHSYPFCERTDTPLIYRAIEAWYLRVEDIRDRLVAANAHVHWMPEHVGGKRFGNWLSEARDWNISRNRFWGSCIPLWGAEDGSGDTLCVGSVAELEALSGEKIGDLHKHRIDSITIERDGRRYRRTPEVLDCWFESGAMFLAQQHYPFERGDELEKFFPADFIAEGLDQTRGWFYTLLVLSVLLFDRAPYRNVVVNGLILAEDGKKMSKRLKNYPDPVEVMQRYGADALRLYMIHSPVVRAENLRFSEAGVRHVLRHLLIPWWNAYSFFVTYANIDKWRPDRHGDSDRYSDNLLDRWILSALDGLISDVTEAMDRYDLQRAVRPFVAFIEDLTNWYIRRSRRRFWKSDDDADKHDAYRTLHYVLTQLSRVAAPFVPFISEAIFRNLRTPDMPESVHLCDFPAAAEGLRDKKLEQGMALIQRIVRMGRQLRTDHELKVRQPLARLHVACSDRATLDRIREFESLAADELNIKAIQYDTDASALAEPIIKPDFKRLGPRFGSRMRAVAAAVEGLSPSALTALADGSAVQLQLSDGTEETLESDDVRIERRPRPGMVVSVERELLVALETTLTPELEREGLAREFVSRVQNMRKAADFEVAERIEIAYAAADDVCTSLMEHDAYVRGETLALTCERRSEASLADVAECADLNGRPCRVAIRKANNRRSG